MDVPCVVFALSRESAPFLRRHRPMRPIRPAPCRAWQSRDVVVLETGVGAARTEMALHWLLDARPLDATPYRPRFVLSAGFCGALQEGWRVGDVILASEVGDED